MHGTASQTPELWKKLLVHGYIQVFPVTAAARAWISGIFFCHCNLYNPYVQVNCILRKSCVIRKCMHIFNLIGLIKAKIVYNFGLSECNKVKFITVL